MVDAILLETLKELQHFSLLSIKLFTFQQQQNYFGRNDTKGGILGNFNTSQTFEEQLLASMW
jgi:hypothetical protein